MFYNSLLAKTIFSSFTPMAFIDNLKYMLSGMIAIFIVIGIIIVFTVILNKILKIKNNKTNCSITYVLRTAK